MSRRLHAVLFDIDQTLLDCVGTGRKAMSAAVERCTGVPGATEGVRFGGRTDPSLVAELVDRVLGPGATTPELYARVLAAYLDVLPPLLRAMGGPRVLPGVVAFLDALEGRGVLRGLATGNVAAGARIKLEATGILAGRFPCGGFGDDHPERPGLTAVAVARLQGLAPGLAVSQVALVGDTPADIAAGRAVGAFTVGVATGAFAAAELAAAGADLVLPDLTHAAALLDLCQPP